MRSTEMLCKFERNSKKKKMMIRAATICITPNVTKKGMSDRCSCRKLQQAVDNYIYIWG
jgi:hypothetical protein